MFLMILGYWRFSDLSEKIYFCEDFDEYCPYKSMQSNYFCVMFFFRGGTSIQCVYGYEGPLCSTCMKGFASLGGKSCSECSSPELNFFLIILGVLGLCTFLMIMTLLKINFSLV